MSSRSIPTQSNSALHDAPRASPTVVLFDQAMVRRSGDCNGLHCIDHGRVAVML